MSIQVGDRIPEANLSAMAEAGPETVSTSAYFSARKVVLFSVPGAFTPTCSAKHLPGFIDNTEALFARGFDAIACMAVNDVFVMSAWGRSAGADRIDMLADGNGEFTSALGLSVHSDSHWSRRTVSSHSFMWRVRVSLASAVLSIFWQNWLSTTLVI
jgi:peroxiredoxin